MGSASAATKEYGKLWATKDAKEVLDILTQWQEKINTLGTDGANALNDLTKYLDFYREVVKKADGAQKDFDKNQALIKVATDSLSTSLSSQQGFDNYIKGIKESDAYSEQLKASIIEIASQWFPEFSGWANDAGQKLDDTGLAVISLTDTLKNLSGAEQDLSLIHI